MTTTVLAKQADAPPLNAPFYWSCAFDSQAFPDLPGYKQWLARRHHLSFQMGAISGQCSVEYHRLDEIYLIDSFPIPMCQAHPPRARQFAER